MGYHVLETGNEDASEMTNTQDQERRGANMNKPNDDAEPSPASAGSRPVAWAVVYFDEIDSVYDTKEDCERFMETQSRRDYLTAVPLYRNPDGEQEYGSLRAENERLRAAIRVLADQDATLSVCGGAVTVTMDATLTDEEREAVECGIQAIGLAPRDERTLAYADRLRGLLERLK
jgi:hypothetical protein